MKRTMLMLLFLFLLTGCYSYTYVRYDKKGKGDIKLKRGLLAPDPDEFNPVIHPRFRTADKPLKQKKGRIKRAHRKKKDA